MRQNVRLGEVKQIAALAAKGMNAQAISERLLIDSDRVAQFMPPAEEAEVQAETKKAKTKKE